jgi:Asp-tRNA(Asn)/Glu-tRNA(Gln) amidotransferase A subunit family amidase
MAGDAPNGASVAAAANGTASAALSSPPPPPEKYYLGTLNAPVLSGPALSAFVALAESSLAGRLISDAVARRSGFGVVRQAAGALPPGEAPLFSVPARDLFPPPPPCCSPPATPASSALACVTLAPGAGPAERVKAACDALGVEVAAAVDNEGGKQKKGGAKKNARGGGGGGGSKTLTTVPPTSSPSPHSPSRPSILDYHQAYLQGTTTPTAVAERLLALLLPPPGSGDPDKSSSSSSSNSTAGPAASTTTTTPAASTHARRYFAAIDRLSVLSAARASTRRYAEGKPLSVLDGVPFAAKDSLPALPLRPTHGTPLTPDEYHGPRRFPPSATAAAEEDAPPVAALRSLGAVCIGLTVMQEVGIMANGFSPRSFPTPGNPHDVTRLCGGSSTGAAAAVAAGLVPLAIGTDGGGSIRVPAALCGVYGLKPTQGRVGRARGAAHTSVTTAGPLAGSAADLLLASAAIMESGGGGGGGEDDSSALTPPLALPRSFLSCRTTAAATTAPPRPLAGARVALWPDWFDDTYSAEVRALCHAAVDMILASRLGATILDDPSTTPAAVPFLEASRVAHALTISTEGFASERGRLWEDRRARRRLNPDTRAAFCLALHRPAQDLLAAAQVRRAASRAWARVFGACDFVVAPAAGEPAPCMPREGSAAARDGWLNAPLTARLVRHNFPANLVGFPAVAVPVGTVWVAGAGGGGGGGAGGAGGGGGGAGRSRGKWLPAALQVMAAPWADGALLAVAGAMERALAEEAEAEAEAADEKRGWRLGPVPLPSDCYFRPFGGSGDGLVGSSAALGGPRGGERRASE